MRGVGEGCFTSMCELGSTRFCFTEYNGFWWLWSWYGYMLIKILQVFEYPTSFCIGCMDCWIYWYFLQIKQYLYWLLCISAYIPWFYASISSFTFILRLVHEFHLFILMVQKELTHLNSLNEKFSVFLPISQRLLFMDSIFFF